MASKRCVKSVNKTPLAIECFEDGNRTRFDWWSDRSMSCLSHHPNQKRNSNIQSRYKNLSRNSMPIKKDYMLDLWQDRKCIWLQQDKLNLSKYDDPRTLREAILPPTELAYLDMLEEDCEQFDVAVAAVHYMVVEDKMWLAHNKKGFKTIPSVQPWPKLWAEVKKRLIEGHGTPLALVWAAFTFVGETPDDKQRDDRWLWVAEKLLFTAMSQVTAGGWEEATCYFAVGWFYANASSANTQGHFLALSIRFLKRAREAAESHYHDWPLPTNIRDTLGVPKSLDGSVWTTTCFVMHDVLIRASHELDPSRSLRAVQYAYRLTELCSLKSSHRAAVAYELGVRHQMVGQFDQATKAFNECATIAAGLDTDLDLDAQLQVACAGPIPMPDDRVLEQIADEAMRRNHYRMRMKAIAARGRVAVNDGRYDEAYEHFALVQRLAEEAADKEELDSARLYAATTQTCIFMQTNFWWLQDVGFNLLAKLQLWNNRQMPYYYDTDFGEFVESDDIQSYSSDADQDKGMMYKGYYPDDIDLSDDYLSDLNHQFVDYLPDQVTTANSYEQIQTNVNQQPIKPKVTFNNPSVNDNSEGSFSNSQVQPRIKTHGARKL